MQKYEISIVDRYPSPFHDPDTSDEKSGNPLQFHTTEQYMMYWKALLMGDDEVAEKILATESPGEAKALGREVRDFDQEVHLPLQIFDL